MALRVLCLSNLYPPAGFGGYELWCQEVSEGLRARGHQVHVLTSRYQRRSASAHDPAWVQRELFLEMDLEPLLNGVKFFTSRTARERRNQDLLQRTIADFRPEVVLVWGMWNLSRALPAAAETLLPGRVVYYIGDYWPTLRSQYEMYWQDEGSHTRIRPVKQALKRYAEPILARLDQPSLAFEHVLVPSAFMGKELARLGAPIEHATVVYGAVDMQPYLANGHENSLRSDSRLSVLYAGQLTPHKGVHTAVEALAILVNDDCVTNVHLTIVGAGEPAYEDHLHRLVAENGLEKVVKFAGKMPKQTMPALYRQAQVFVFPSIWPEPFGRVLVEAMASGLAVVGTPVGGAAEILGDDETALTFQPENPVELAHCLKRIVHEPALQWRLANNARRWAVERFNLDRMVDSVEDYVTVHVQNQ